MASARRQGGGGSGVVHLVADQPGGDLVREVRPGTYPPAGALMHDPHDRTRPLRSDRCSPGTAGSTSPSNTPWMPRRSGSPRTTNTSRASSPTTGPTPPTWATSPPSTGGRAPGRRALRRIPLPRCIYRGQTRRRRSGHPLRALVAHGRRDRRTATPTGRHRECARPPVLTRCPRTFGRRRPCAPQPPRCNPRRCNPSRSGTRPVGSGRPRSSTSTGCRRRTRRSGPTCGMTHNGSAYRLPLLALLTRGFASSSWPAARMLFRTPLATDSTRGGESLEQVRAPRGTIALSHRIIDLALSGPAASQRKSNESEVLWSLIEGIFAAGDAMPVPSPNGSTSPDDRLLRQHF